MNRVHEVMIIDNFSLSGGEQLITCRIWCEIVNLN